MRLPRLGLLFIVVPIVLRFIRSRRASAGR
jgi:hypothetical protein